MVDKQIVEKIRNYLQRLKENGLEIKKAILFGSWSTDKAHKESDIDLILVSPLFDLEVDKYMGKIWKFTNESDYQIEPIAVGERQFENDRVSPLLELVRWKGIEFSKLITQSDNE